MACSAQVIQLSANMSIVVLFCQCEDHPNICLFKLRSEA